MKDSLAPEFCRATHAHAAGCPACKTAIILSGMYARCLTVLDRIRHNQIANLLEAKK